MLCDKHDARDITNQSISAQSLLSRTEALLTWSGVVSF